MARRVAGVAARTNVLVGSLVMVRSPRQLVVTELRCIGADLEVR